MSRGMKRLIAGAGVLAGLNFAPAALAAPVVDGEFAVAGGVDSNTEIVQGPDGNMWVTLASVAGVARITPAGVVTQFTPPGLAANAIGIAVGPDGNLWVSQNGSVAKIPPADPNAAQQFNVATLTNGRGITAGPDGNMWAVGDDKLVRFSTVDPTGSATTTPITGMSARGMTLATDGLLWIADNSGRAISATAETAPTVTPIDLGGGLQDIGAGLSGQVAYANPQANPQSVGRISPGVAPLVSELAPSDPFGVAFGVDQAYWIARAGTNDLLRLAPDGTTTPLTGFSPAAAGLGPRKVAAGPNNTLWVTLDEEESVARVSGLEAPVVTPPIGGEPETTIDKGPKRKVKTSKKRAKVKFKFSSSAAAVTFECALDRKKKGKPNKPGTFAPCTSPKQYRLKPAKYTFKVRGVLAGAADATPAEQKLKVVFERR